MQNYTSTTTVGLNFNFNNQLINNQLFSEVQNSKDGFSTEFQTMHGFYVLKYFALQIGVGLDYNVNRTYVATPIFAGFKWYLYEYGNDSPYLFLDVGQNIAINGFSKSGDVNRVGFAYSSSIDSQKDMVFEFYRKLKNSNLDYDNYYMLESYGFSVGLKF